MLVDQCVKRVLLCERRRRLEVVIFEVLTSRLLSDPQRLATQLPMTAYHLTR